MSHLETLSQFHIITQVEMGFSPCAMLICPTHSSFFCEEC
jgi:hypothetical protein